MNPQKPHIYIGQIAPGLSCQISIKEQDLNDGDVSAIVFEWTGRPSTSDHLAKYSLFKRGVFQDISNRSGKRIMDVSLMPGGKVVTTVFTPQAEMIVEKYPGNRETGV